MFTNSRIIVALDGLDSTRAVDLIAGLRSHVWGFKFNDLLYSDRLPQLVDQAGSSGLFFDFKLHDIPNTVANTMRRVCERFKPQLVTVHASGGPTMLRAAVETAREVRGGDTKVLAVTVLTSLDKATCREIYGTTPQERVQMLAESAAGAGCDGIVCSPNELPVLNDLPLLRIVPGIRPEWYQAEVATGARQDDQARIATPAAAIQAGASALVIGRPIVKANDPVSAARLTARELADAAG
jgi:orotidine-5'-phosphate decarboxylase